MSELAVPGRWGRRGDQKRFVGAAIGILLIVIVFVAVVFVIEIFIVV